MKALAQLREDLGPAPAWFGVMRRAGVVPAPSSFVVWAVLLACVRLLPGGWRLGALALLAAASALWARHAWPVLGIRGLVPWGLAAFGFPPGRGPEVAAARVLTSWHKTLGPTGVRLGDFRQDGPVLRLRLRVPIGTDPGALVKLVPTLRGAWHAEDLTVETWGGLVEYSWRVGADPLAEPVPLSAVPAGDRDGVRSLPVGVDEFGHVLRLERHHVLISGASGAGKGAILWNVVRAFMPAAERGLVRFVGLDSKRSEVAACEGLFDRVAYSAGEHLETLGGIVATLGARAELKGRESFVPSEALPLIVVVIDEFSSFSGLFTDAKQRSRADADLRRILSQGRSLGVLVVAAGQEVTKEAVKHRDLFGVRVAGRLATREEARLALGEAAVEAGARPDLIPIATPANGHATAGVIWAQDAASGRWVRARVPFVDDDELGRMAERVRLSS